MVQFYGFRYRENFLCSCYCQSSGMWLLNVLVFPFALFLNWYLSILHYPLPMKKKTHIIAILEATFKDVMYDIKWGTLDMFHLHVN